MEFTSSVASFNHNSVFTDWNVDVDEYEYEFDCYSKMRCACVGVKENAGLTNAQMELLLWH